MLRRRSCSDRFVCIPYPIRQEIWWRKYGTNKVICQVILNIYCDFLWKFSCDFLVNHSPENLGLVSSSGSSPNEIIKEWSGRNRSYAKLSLSLQERIINGGYPEVQSRWKVTGIMSFRGVRATRNLNVGVMQTSHILVPPARYWLRRSWFPFSWMP